MKLYQLLTLSLLIFGINACQKDENATDHLFTLLNSNYTNIDFTNPLPTKKTNILQYLYAYNGGGVAIGDINNDDLPDIFFTANENSNQLYLNKGNLKFENISAAAGIEGTGDWKTGVNMADINGDGWLDIYVCQVGEYKNLHGKNQLFINQKNNTFKEAAAQYGLDHKGFSTQSAFFDYDKDDDLDLFLLCHSTHSTDNYRDTSNRFVTDYASGDKLFRNDGNHFTEVTQEAGIISSKIGYGLGIAISDLNGDNCPDIYIGNDFHENDYLYYNNCDGTFTEAITNSTAHNSTFSMGNDIADINNDGLPDIVTLDMRPEDLEVLKNSIGADNWGLQQFKLRYGYHHQFPRNMLQLNQGDLRGDAKVQFSEIGQLAGIEATDWSWSPLIADFDNDGWKDIFVANGIVKRPNDLDFLKTAPNTIRRGDIRQDNIINQMPEGKVSNYIFQNQKDLSFENKAVDWGLDQASWSTGAAYADLDNDGDLDLVTNNLAEPAFIYRNNLHATNHKHFINIRTEGIGKNIFGLGAKVFIWHKGKMAFQEVSPCRGFQSSSDVRLHFGLGESTLIDSILVIWNSGRSQKLESIEVDRSLTIKEQEASDLKIYTKKTKALFKDVTTKYKLDFTHHENNYSDPNRESLMPYLLSTQGPSIAVADVNGDGLEDFYVGGAQGQGGALFFQNENSIFQSTSKELWRQDISFEDVDVTFFDADNDKDLDLYLVHAGNQKSGKSVVLKDHFFDNDGKGNFSRNKTAFPEIFENGSCLRPCDFDGDGDLDLFLGSRVLNRSYGSSPTSYLLENDGTGNFTDVTAAKAPSLSQVGMVTDAIWLDLNQDQQEDLIIVGEWMPITIFINKNGQFKKTIIPNSEGWWNTINAADFDQDGDVDLVAGNLGWNTFLSASPKNPIKLHLKDFDNNRSTDPIISHYQNGIQYPFHNLDELAGQLVQLKKEYRTYRAFSKENFSTIFPNKFLEGAFQKEVKTLSTSYFKNKGNAIFEQEALAQSAQLSPIQSILCGDFNRDGFLDIILGGNFYEVQANLGRFDASFGQFLKGDGKGNFESILPIESGLSIFGQVRDIKQVKLANGKNLILVARNDDKLQLFEY